MISMNAFMHMIVAMQLGLNNIDYSSDLRGIVDDFIKENQGEIVHSENTIALAKRVTQYCKMVKCNEMNKNDQLD